MKCKKLTYIWLKPWTKTSFNLKAFGLLISVLLRGDLRYITGWKCDLSVLLTQNNISTNYSCLINHNRFELTFWTVCCRCWAAVSPQRADTEQITLLVFFQAALLLCSLCKAITHISRVQDETKHTSKSLTHSRARTQDICKRLILKGKL